jgi:hypothetical protein
MRRLLVLMALCVAFAVLFAPGKTSTVAIPHASVTDGVVGAVLAPTLDQGDTAKKPHLGVSAMVAIGVVASITPRLRPSPGRFDARTRPSVEFPTLTRLVEGRAPPRQIR